ncbi:MAG: peptidoglycan DD-metalloendopeptidase family protein [Proteobacteria bacterium]|nr:peptidoglycan DD-metalloendopeptidase family protein [Pseudomonadota bacterium]
MVFATAMLCFIAPVVVIAAETPMRMAQDAAIELKAAAATLQKAKKSNDRVAALSQTVRAYESGLQAVRQSLRAATIRKQALQLELTSQRAQISRLLGVLQTIERASTPMLMIHPAGPVGTARSGMVMSEVAPMLQQRAEDLQIRLEELLVLNILQKDAEKELEGGLTGAKDARIALSAAINDRTELPLRYAADPVHTQILMDNSKTLDFFATGLTDIPLDDDLGEQKPFTTTKGQLPLPTDGVLLRDFNEADAAGIKRPGIVITARPLSLVTAPAPATIRFAGSFLDYGKVVILEPEPGYLIVIAGLHQIYGVFGQIVNIGDPIGLLGGKQPQVQDFLIEASEGGGTIGQESLYIEIRNNGKPVNPTDWFALSNI